MSDSRQSDAPFVRLVPSGEVYLKSRRTRDRFLRTLVTNVRAGLAAAGLEVSARRTGQHEVGVFGPDLDAAAAVGARTFGVQRAERVVPVEFDSLDQLAKLTAEMAREKVAGKTFAVRVRRRGLHDWSSQDAAVEIGSLLLDDSAGVDLVNPQVTVRLHVNGRRALLVDDVRAGPDGLPAGAQQRVLALISGGIDSPVAAWMMMRRGCAVDFLHLKLDCSVSDHALVVANELVVGWGHGPGSRFHVVDFQPVKDQLRERVAPRTRQVLLKQLMLAAGAKVAARSGIELIVTGDSLGQVSSQTAAHLARIDRHVGFPTLRPLVGMSKNEIIARSRQIGLFDLSTRAREVCDLSDGRPVETAASEMRLEADHRRLDDRLIEDALGTWESVAASAWSPGIPLEPVAGPAELAGEPASI